MEFSAGYHERERELYFQGRNLFSSGLPSKDRRAVEERKIDSYNYPWEIVGLIQLKLKYSLKVEIKTDDSAISDIKFFESSSLSNIAPSKIWGKFELGLYGVLVVNLWKSAKSFYAIAVAFEQLFPSNP